MKTFVFAVTVIAGMVAGLVIGLTTMRDQARYMLYSDNMHLALNTGAGTLVGVVIGWMATWFGDKAK